MHVFIEKYPLFYNENPSSLLVNICGTDEIDIIDNTIKSLGQQWDDGLCMLCYTVANWNDDLSPWHADPVWGNEAFGGNAEQTLNDILSLIRKAKDYLGCSDSIPIIIGGYSLAGLFALWSAYQTDVFSGVASASPSVWFPGWTEYSSSHIIHTDYVYLSLGDKEAKTRNQVMSTVRKCIEKEYNHLISSETIKNTILEFNPGNHFQDPDKRLAKAFLWNINQILNS